MRIETVVLQPYRLPLRRPWVSARGRVAERAGWLVEIACGGTSGFGDCAPLPEAGTESAADAWQALQEAQGRLPGLSLAQALGSPDAAASPAAACALECALLDLESRLHGLALRRALAHDAADRVPVNGALGALSGVAAADLERAARAGWRVLKLKVGVEDLGGELKRLHALAPALPSGLALRLDANGAWDLQEARHAVAALAGLPIECLEEPLADPDPAALALLQSRAGFPLALDESLPRLLARGLAPALWPVRRAVLKPAVLGGLRRTLGLARRLQKAGIEVVATGVVESAAGLWPTAQLAAAIGSTIPQGLATADWLARDLGAAPRPSGATLHLPTRPGSGFVPDADGPARGEPATDRVSQP